MAGFQKPKPLKAALKIGVYGPAGSGKTFTSLLIAEGLSKHTKKRVAFVDTELGTAFYGQHVAERATHPEPFDFDALYTKSISEVLAEIKKLDPATHGILVVDSITHLWEACKGAYSGKLTSVGGIPLYAWGTIKRPHKELVNVLLSSPMHVLICGRQGTEYGDDEETGELKNLGYKMKAEGETTYEPDIVLRLESHRAGKRKGGAMVPAAHIEKDRTGVLAGKCIEWPTFANIARPLLGLLGTKQTAMPSDDEVSAADADALGELERDREQHSRELAAEWSAKLTLAKSTEEIKALNAQITPAVKKHFTAADLDTLRQHYKSRLARLEPTETLRQLKASLALDNGAG
jgi:hypothetical protein